jgi:sugar (pentulose or hexulose) kinase
MQPAPSRHGDLAAGVDLGTSGLRLTLVDGGGASVAERAIAYPRPFEQPEGWREGLKALCAALPALLRQRVGAIALDGTSGTLLACDRDGRPLGPALSYGLACPEQAGRLAGLVPPTSPAASPSGSLARALRLRERHGEQALLRHQADWLMGWLLGDWRWGEEGNNLRLGWDLRRQCWAGRLDAGPWPEVLPRIVPSGTVLGTLQAGAAAALGLPPSCRVVAGTTDANAAVLAARPEAGDGITVLGTTLVLKCFAGQPIEAPGVSSHRLAGRWLIGGASNAGAGVLRRFFDDDTIRRLSRQIDPERPSGLALRPLPGRGERFPVDDPLMEPVLEPRPVSDLLFLQALLEGLAAIEAQGWRRLRELGAPPIQRVISLGGGARNPQWRRLRQRALGMPVLNRPDLAPALGTARLALGGLIDPGGGGDGGERMGTSLPPLPKPP